MKCQHLHVGMQARASAFSYLHQVVGGIVHQHDQSAGPDVVDQPRESDERNGGYMVNDLLLEILQDEKRKLHFLHGWRRNSNYNGKFGSS